MNDLTLHLSVPFPNEREADIAYQVLRVDEEPKRSGVKKTIVVESNKLLISFSAKETRKMRVGLTSFFDALLLVTETMNAFDGREPVYDYY